MADRCRWMHDPEIGRWHYPGCMGAAVYGPEGCTCPAPKRKEKDDSIEARVALLESRLAKLEKAIAEGKGIG